MSRLLTITHETTYRYHQPMRFGPHRLVLRPREGHDQRVEKMVIDITPAFSISWSRDVFGNSIATVDLLEAANELRITSVVDISRSDFGAVYEPPQPLVGFPVVYDEIERLVAAAYQAPLYPQDAEVLRTWIGKALEEPHAPGAVALVETLNLAVNRGIRYVRREEKGVQGPAETLAKGTGSCRDLATLLMEACRALGIASRFTSGYLDCAASLAGRAATHAWTEVYLSGCGWTGFDPTLGEKTSHKHVSVGVSNHPRGVMPVAGRFYGSSADCIGMTVAVHIAATAARAI